jgi:trans-aconitate 2-methyltransferase
VTSYTFGDSAIASERLRIVAEVMEPVAREFLGRVREPERVRDVLDLGCGPGHTTRLLAACFPNATVTGIDQSTAYVDEARLTAGARCQFVVSDVDVAALPGAPADVIYARYLLSHLVDVPRAVTRWCDALRPDGSLCLEEPEAISSTDPDFREYERVASSLVQTTGASLYAGPLIAAMATPEGVDRVHDETAVIDITAGQAAAMFWRNTRAWDRDALARAGHDAAAVERIGNRLRARENDPTRGLFDWRQRQVIFTKPRG